jgi:cellulose synthase operon protein C
MMTLSPKGVVVALALLLLSACTPPEQKAKAYNESGQAYLDKGDFVRAALEFRNALKIKQDYADAWFGMAQVEQNNKNWNAVAGDLNKVLELDPKHLKARSALARLLLLGSNAQEALKIVDVGIGQNPLDASLLALKAAILLKMGNKEEAIREANRSLQLNAKSIDALMVLASERLLVNDTAASKVQLDKGLAIEPNAIALHLFALALAEKNNDVAAQEASLRKIISIEPAQRGYQRALVSFFIAQKRYPDAEAELRSIAVANPEDVSANLDVVKFMLTFPGKGSDAAVAELLGLIATGKQAPAYKSALAQLMFELGKGDEATTILRELIAKEGITEAGIAARLDLSNKLLTMQRFDDAEPLITEALANDAGNAEGLRQRAAVKLAKGDIEAAENDLRSALNEEPENAALHKMMAAVNERNGSIELADKNMADALKTSKYSADASLDYARFLVRRGQPDRAETILADVLQRSPNSVEIMAALADLKLRRQDWVGARQLADAMKAAPGTQALSGQIAAASLVGQNKLDESIQVLLSANSDASSNSLTKFALVQAYLKAGKFKEAEDYLKTILVAEPNSSEARTLLGVVQLNTNRVDEAKLSFEAAIAMEPMKSVGYRALADFQMHSGQTEQAQKTLQSALSKMPKDMDVKFLIASIQEQTGQIDLAILTYEDMLKQDPNSLIAANNYASLVSDHRTDPASIGKAATAAAVLRSSPIAQFKDTLGWVLFLRGQPAEALELLKQSTADLPDMALTNYHLGKAYEATGDAVSAKASFERALKFAKTDREKTLIETAIKNPQPPSKPAP